MVALARHFSPYIKHQSPLPEFGHGTLSRAFVLLRAARPAALPTVVTGVGERHGKRLRRPRRRDPLLSFA